MGEAKRRREPKHEAETIAAGRAKTGTSEGSRQRRSKSLSWTVWPHEREMAPPRFGMISATHLQRLQLEGDAAAAKGRRALDEWMDGLTGDEIAAVTIAMQHRWREIAQRLG
jgi:hypothetical protein